MITHRHSVRPVRPSSSPPPRPLGRRLPHRSDYTYLQRKSFIYGVQPEPPANDLRTERTSAASLILHIFTKEIAHIRGPTGAAAQVSAPSFDVCRIAQKIPGTCTLHTNAFQNLAGAIPNHKTSSLPNLTVGLYSESRRGAILNCIR